jgi:hypothetical protein
MIRGLNLPGTPRATSAFRGTALLLLYIFDQANRYKMYWVLMEAELTGEAETIRENISYF